MPTRPLTWLQLTDLHVGQPREYDRYENIEQALFDDLRRLQRDDDWHWDVVFFTGDLAFRGSDGEYAGVTRRLGRILEEVQRLNGGGDEHRPVLVTVPGNHDLARPDPLTVSRVRASWQGSSLYRESLWRGENPDLRAILERAFDAYTRWHRTHPFRRPEEVSDNGLVPGDFAATATIRGLRLGVVGLNSSFLHLGDSEPGELDLRLEQLRAVCGDYEGWARNHHLRILLTHHPVDWLCPAGRAAFEEEIRHGDRFDIHLYGHMHAGGHTAAATVDGFRYSMQGRSLFGAEEDGHPRMHGVAMGRFQIADDKRTMDLHQREGWRVDGRGWAFGPLAGSSRRSWFIRAELGPVPDRADAEDGGLRGLAAEKISTPDKLAAILTLDGGSPRKILFLSASVPRPRTEAGRREAEQKFLAGADRTTIQKTVQELGKRAMERGFAVLFGGHPSISEALLPLALGPGRPTTSRPWLYLCQHLHFNWHLHDATAALARSPDVALILVDGSEPGVTGPTEAALARLRACMLGVPNLAAGVFLGGMKGVEDEFTLFTTKHPKARKYALGVGGGAASKLLKEQTSIARGGLADSAPLWADPAAAAEAVFKDLDAT